MIEFAQVCKNCAKRSDAFAQNNHELLSAHEDRKEIILDKNNPFFERESLLLGLLFYHSFLLVFHLFAISRVDI